MTSNQLIMPSIGLRWFETRWAEHGMTYIARLYRCISCNTLQLWLPSWMCLKCQICQLAEIQRGNWRFVHAFLSFLSSSTFREARWYPECTFWWKWMEMDGNRWKWMEMDGNGWKWMEMDGNGWNMMKPKLLKDPKGVVNSQVYHETFMVHTDHSVGSELMGFHCDSMPATSVNKCTLQYTLHHFTCMFLKRHLLLYCMVLVAFVCVVKGLKPCECESLHLRTDQLSCLGSSTSECPIR